jgi:hypothetical protein
LCHHHCHLCGGGGVVIVVVVVVVAGSCSWGLMVVDGAGGGVLCWKSVIIIKGNGRVYLSIAPPVFAIVITLLRLQEDS